MVWIMNFIIHFLPLPLIRKKHRNVFFLIVQKNQFLSQKIFVIRIKSVHFSLVTLLTYTDFKYIYSSYHPMRSFRFTGKTRTMIGSSESSSTLGVIPCAITWLYRAVNEQKQKTGARFSVRVSAVEITSVSQQIKDLLTDYASGKLAMRTNFL